MCFRSASALVSVAGRSPFSFLLFQYFLPSSPQTHVLVEEAANFRYKTSPRQARPRGTTAPAASSQQGWTSSHAAARGRSIAVSQLGSTTTITIISTNHNSSTIAPQRRTNRGTNEARTTPLRCSCSCISTYPDISRSYPSRKPGEGRQVDQISWVVYRNRKERRRRRRRWGRQLQLRLRSRLPW